MLRGVAGRLDGSTQAVGIPFIAIRMTDDRSFDTVDFAPIKKGKHPVCRLHADGRVIVGEVSAKNFPTLFAYSEYLFSTILGVKNGLFHDEGIVLHTIIARHLDEADTSDKINCAGWTEAVDTCAKHASQLQS